MDLRRFDDEITVVEKILCSIMRKKTKNKNKNKIPPIIAKRSKKIYGFRDNLKRYYINKYMGIPIGRYSYGCESMGLEFFKQVGSFVSIARGTTGVYGNHHMEFVTTSPILTDKEFGFTEDFKMKEILNTIEIGNDVWIGASCLIFPFVKIGDGAVIAAGSIVRKDVPPYAVVGGVDRIIKYRFSNDIIRKLLKIKWWDWSDEKIRENKDIMYDIDKFVEKFYKEEE